MSTTECTKVPILDIVAMQCIPSLVKKNAELKILVLRIEGAKSS